MTYDFAWQRMTSITAYLLMCLPETLLYFLDSLIDWIHTNTLQRKEPNGREVTTTLQLKIFSYLFNFSQQLPRSITSPLLLKLSHWIIYCTSLFPQSTSIKRFIFSFVYTSTPRFINFIFFYFQFRFVAFQLLYFILIIFYFNLLYFPHFLSFHFSFVTFKFFYTLIGSVPYFVSFSFQDFFTQHWAVYYTFFLFFLDS